MTPAGPLAGVSYFPAWFVKSRKPPKDITDPLTIRCSRLSSQQPSPRDSCPSWFRTSQYPPVPLFDPA